VLVGLRWPTLLGQPQTSDFVRRALHYPFLNGLPPCAEYVRRYMNALLKPSRRNRLNASPYRDEIVLGQRQENAFCTIRPSPPITLSAANKPFAKTINLV